MSSIDLDRATDIIKGNGDLFARHFSSFISRKAAPITATTCLPSLACLLVHMQSAGHVCLDLANPPTIQDRDTYKAVRLPGIDQLMTDLEQFRNKLIAFDLYTSGMPFVLKGHYLYLARYWQYERDVEHRIHRWLNSEVADRGTIPEGLFKETEKATPQYAAVKKALGTRFSIISGGPGTGKTTIAVKILAASLANEPHARVALAAPTGKAAARMKESIGQNVLKMEIDDAIRSAVVDLEAFTLHRLLEPRYNTPYFKRDRENPLPYDLVIVDESSMIDLPMMAKLMDAIDDQTTVVLIGDPDQLPPVEVGSVFGQIIRGGIVAPVVTTLTENHRAHEAEDIIELCNCINLGNTDKALDILISSQSRQVAWNRIENADDLQDLIGMATKRFHSEFTGPGPGVQGNAILQGVKRFRVLTAVLRGPFGSENINSRIQSRLGSKKELVMIIRNDAQNKIFNGDIGIIISHDGVQEIWIEGRPAPVSPLRVPEYQTAYAMTGHKAQGSEFDEVHIVLPADSNCPLLNREWLYTAVSRAKRNVTIWASEASLRKCLNTRICRSSSMALPSGPQQSRG